MQMMKDLLKLHNTHKCLSIVKRAKVLGWDNQKQKFMKKWDNMGEKKANVSQVDENVDG